MGRRLGLLAALIVFGATSVRAQTPPADDPAQEPPASTLEDVVVDGRPLEERAREFVDEIAQPARHRGLARWDGPACFGVVNFRGDVARAIADRLVARADELGLPVGELNCEPNVFVVGTDDGPGVARAWVERTPEVFEQRYSGATAPPSALANFVSTDAAVRWWHISLPMHFDVFTGESEAAVRIPGHAPPTLRVYAKSQHASRIRDDLQKVLVLIDVERIGAVTIAQLCDYLLMVAYAQIDPEGETSTYETILNLFDDPSVPGLAEWDRAYLTSLYEYDPTRRASAGQQGERLADELRVDSPAASE